MSDVVIDTGAVNAAATTVAGIATVLEELGFSLRGQSDIVDAGLQGTATGGLLAGGFDDLLVAAQQFVQVASDVAAGLSAVATNYQRLESATTYALGGPVRAQ